jgi:hypothetical protein
MNWSFLIFNGNAFAARTFQARTFQLLRWPSFTIQPLRFACDKLSKIKVPQLDCGV